MQIGIGPYFKFSWRSIPIFLSVKVPQNVPMSSEASDGDASWVSQAKPAAEEAVLPNDRLVELLCEVRRLERQFSGRLSVEHCAWLCEEFTDLYELPQLAVAQHARDYRKAARRRLQQDAHAPVDGVLLLWSQPQLAELRAAGRRADELTLPMLLEKPNSRGTALLRELFALQQALYSEQPCSWTVAADLGKEHWEALLRKARTQQAAYNAEAEHLQRRAQRHQLLDWGPLSALRERVDALGESESSGSGERHPSESAESEPSGSSDGAESRGDAAESRGAVVDHCRGPVDDSHATTAAAQRPTAVAL